MARSQNRYENNFHWCGHCGQWHKVSDSDAANRCPDCNYMLRRAALLKAKRRPQEVVRI